MKHQRRTWETQKVCLLYLCEKYPVVFEALASTESAQECLRPDLHTLLLTTPLFCCLFVDPLSSSLWLSPPCAVQGFRPCRPLTYEIKWILLVLPRSSDAQSRPCPHLQEACHEYIVISGANTERYHLDSLKLVSLVGFVQLNVHS